MTAKHSTPRPRISRSDTGSASSIRRHSKIARLPAERRERLNQMLHDGLPYSTIIKTFADLGHQLNQANLSRWHSGGFKDWLRDQAYLDEMRSRLDFASSLLKQPNADLIDQASLRIAITRMYTLLLDFDPSTLRHKLAENPGAYVRVLNALCHLTKASMKLHQDKLPRALF